MSPYLDPDSGSRLPPKFNGDFLTHGTSMIKFSQKNPIALSKDISQIAKNALSRNVEESFKKFLDPRIRRRMVSKMLSVLHSLQILVVIFLRSFYIKLLDYNRQTDKQTPGIRLWRT